MKFEITLKNENTHTIVAENLNEAERIANQKFKTWQDLKNAEYIIDHNLKEKTK